jgi:glycosyltransferase involved in cell wall biosynthesis
LIGMKLLVFAHVPPPLHGQSQMVAYLVDGFRRDPALGVEVEHVDARLSEDLADVGSARGGKLSRLLRYCWAAWRIWLRGETSVLYYVPSPPKRNSLYRDWIVLALLRPWFGRVVFHWHAVGLGAWLEGSARGWERWLSHRLLGGVDLALVLSAFNEGDARKLAPARVGRVANGVPDPCPEFARDLAPLRRQRWVARQRGEGEVRVLFLAHGTRDKGLFDALEAVALANRAAGRARFRLRVAGSFVTPEEEREYRERVAQADLVGVVEHAGFVTGEAKARELREAEIFLFPSYFANEGQPLNLIEAMAYGLPLVTTRWRGIPEMVPAGYAGLVEPRDPAAAAAALAVVAGSEDGLRFRERYLAEYSLEAHLRALAAVLRSV